jgi:hypothetical protein
MVTDSLGLFALPNEKSADGQSRLNGWIGRTNEPSLLRFAGRSGSVISTRNDILIYFAVGSIKIKARGYLYRVSKKKLSHPDYEHVVAMSIARLLGQVVVGTRPT